MTLEYAKMLIDDAEAGGAKYNTQFICFIC